MRNSIWVVGVSGEPLTGINSILELLSIGAGIGIGVGAGAGVEVEDGVGGSQAIKIIDPTIVRFINDKLFMVSSSFFGAV